MKGLFPRGGSSGASQRTVAAFERASPPVGTAVELASASVAVPRGDSGVVLFSAKSGTHGGDFTDTGFTSNGTISLWLTIDGRRAGPRVFQQVASPSSAAAGRSR